MGTRSKGGAPQEAEEEPPVRGAPGDAGAGGAREAGRGWSALNRCVRSAERDHWLSRAGCHF